MSTRITLAESRHRLRTLAESRGDTVAGGLGRGCMYFSNPGVPSCIVGTAFAAELLAAGVNYGNPANDVSVEGLIDCTQIASPLDIEPDAVTYLMAAQETQDNGLSWSAAVGNAEALIDEVLAERAVEDDVFPLAA